MNSGTLNWHHDTGSGPTRGNSTSFHDDFTAYFETHIAEGERVFVLVDDLDRCDPAQAAELLRAIHLMIPENLQVVFVLAIDRLKVAAGIAAAQEKLLPLIVSGYAGSAETKVSPHAALSYGYEFLEKFIQLPFRLPRMSIRNVAPFIDSLVRRTPTPTSYVVSHARGARPEDVVDTDSPAVQAVVLKMAPVLGFNPRRLKQFLNLFRLRHLLLGTANRLWRGGPTLVQLGKIVALEVRWPRLVEDVLRRPALLQELEKVAVEKAVSVEAAAPAPSGAAPPPPGKDVSWADDQNLLEFLVSGGESDHIGGLDLGAILGSAPNAVASGAMVRQTGSVAAAIGKHEQADVAQSPSVSAVVRTAEGVESRPLDPNAKKPAE